MSKDWAEHSAEEKQEILDRIADIYAEHKHPGWLKKPVIKETVVNVLPINGQRVQ
jgi:uncharacterized protein (UPF0335 family)